VSETETKTESHTMQTKSAKEQAAAIEQLRQAIRSMWLELDYPIEPSEEWTRRRAQLRQALRQAGWDVSYGAPPSELIALGEELLRELPEQ
jgi:hypothetical protein